MHFQLTDLRLIIAIAETNSLTKGAEKCHLSLPAVSVRIKNLEESIGAKLLYRSSAGVTLTPAGNALVHHARIIHSQLENLRGDMQEYGRGIKGHLRLFASATATAEFLPDVLSRFLATHPDVNIDLQERMSADIVRAVVEGQTDLGIVSGPVALDALESIHYRDDRLVLVVAREHEFASRGEVPFLETLRHDHVSLGEGSAIHTFVRQQAQELKQRIHLRIQVAGFEACCRMIEAGVGIGVMPESTARRHAQHMGIQVVKLEDPWSLRKQYICMRSIATLPSYARELIDLLAPGSLD